MTSLLLLTATIALFLTDVASMPMEKDAAIIDGYSADSRGFPWKYPNRHSSMFPWACALFFNGSFVCTSSLISDRDILTAGHCVHFNGKLQSASMYHAICNVSKSALGARIEFTKVNLRSGFEPVSLEHDIAVLNAKEPVAVREEVQPICLPNRPMHFKMAIVMGWGQTNRGHDPGVLPDDLHWVAQFIVSNGFCSMLYNGISENKICASGPLTSFCYGDSGGPLVHLKYGRRPVQIGVTSYVSGEFGCGKIFPTVFSSVSFYLDFIRESAAGHLCTI